MPTVLQPGDIAFVGFNFDNPDEFAFLALRDITVGTEIVYTDNGWLASGGFRATEGSFTWTASEAVAAGTIINPAPSSVLFSVSGDQILAYQGDAAAPTFIAALNSEGAGTWQSDATSPNTSALPTGLTEGENALALPEIDNAVYTGPTTGTRAELLAAINDAANWEGSNATRQDMPTAPFTILDAAPARPVINEMFVSHAALDDTEFAELFGTPGQSLDGLSLIGVESDAIAANGTIDFRFDFDASHMIGENGFFLLGNPIGLAENYGVTPNAEIGANAFENSSTTYALVETASLTGDAVTGSEIVLDSVALSDGDARDSFFFGAPVVGPDGPFLPAGARRAEDGVDTDAASDWLIGDFGLGPANTPTAGTAAGPGRSALLLSEIVVTPTAGEFIEIFNPGEATVDLSNIYLTDATFAPGGTFYYNITTNANSGGGSFADFLARFPDAATIAPGEYLTVALGGSADFLATYGIAPDFELFDDGSNDGEAVMREGIPGSINGQGGLTNGGEVVVLFEWDGESDLVGDHDYVVWGDKDEAVDKTGVAVDGPDADGAASTYLPETAIADQDVVAARGHASGLSFQRIDLTEGEEVQSGSNGVTGADETSENLSVTWTALAEPTPGAAAPDGLGGGPGSEPTLISTIQGTGRESLLVGQTVTVSAIVVGDFQNRDADETRNLGGFFLQEEDSDADGDAMSSEGIFVFDRNLDPFFDVEWGDQVIVTGTVTEFFGETQIIATRVERVASDQGAQVTAATIDLPTTGTVINADGELIADLEAYEGMLVSFADTLTVTEMFNYDRFGEIRASEGGQLRQFTQDNAPSIEGFAAHLEAVASRTITIDDGQTEQNPDPILVPDGTAFDQSTVFRMGDELDDLLGVVRFSRGTGGSGDETYRINLVEEATITQANPRPAEVPDVGGTITAASVNVLNFFSTLDLSGNTSGPANLDPRGADNQAEFDRQQEKLVEALLAMDADIYGLVEIENDFRPGSPGNAVETLVAAMNAVAGPGAYDWVYPGRDFVDVSDAISNAFVYRTATVELTEGSSVAILDDAALAALDPSFGIVFDGPSTNRAALAASFTEIATGGAVTVAVNHFKSKGSIFDDANAAIGDGQANNNPLRVKAAEAVDLWLASDPTGTGDPDKLILGDLNAYAKEDPITALEAAGFTNLEKAFLDPGDPDYSFVFDGQVGTLDYALANESLLGQITGAAVWDVNAPEPDLIDYNLDFGRPGEIFDGDTPFRFSDHDPILVGMTLEAPAPATAFARVEFLDRRFGGEAEYSLDGEVLDVERLRLLQRDIEIDAAGLTITADDGNRRSPDFLTTEGEGLGVRSFGRDGAFRSDRKALDGQETMTFVLDEGDGLGDALSVIFEFAEARRSGEVELTFFDDGAEVDQVLLAIVDDRIAYDLEGDQGFDTVEIGVRGPLQLEIGAVGFDRLITDDGFVV